MNNPFGRNAPAPTPQPQLETAAPPPQPNAGAHFLVRSYHGGFCCGMSHIYAFPLTPQRICAAREKVEAVKWAEHQRRLPSSGLRINDGRPQETAAERLEGLIDDIKRDRRRGIIEVVLTEAQAGSGSPTWDEELLKRGFNMVQTGVNSNTGRTLCVYLLTYED